MSNPFYTRAFNALAGSLARARQMINEFQLIQGGFDAVDVKTAILLGDLTGALDYSPSTPYITGGYVRYLGSVYRAKQATTGNLPTNATFWQRVDIGAKDLTLLGQTTGIALRSSALIFRIDGAGANSPANIVLTAFLHPVLAGPASFSVISGTATLTGTGNTRTLTFANMGSDAVTIRAAVVDGSVTYTDDVTLYKVRDGVSPTSLNANDLVSGTVPDARFPAALPAVSGANLVALSAAQLLGIVPNASFPATLPAGVTVPAGQLSGDVIQARIATALNASGAAPIYPCRAWVNFNGTGVISINPGASGNVSSITDNGIGDYTINFITNMQDTNFCVVSTGSNDVGDTSYRNTTNQNRSTLTVSSCRIFAHGVNSANQIKEDAGNINVAVFR